MKFLDTVFDKFNGKCISGLSEELKVQYINYLSRKYDKDIIVLTSSLYEATKYYNYIGIYNDNSYIFPMDDFVSSMLTASSPDLKVKRLDTLSHINDKNRKIVVTNLDGFLKFLPSKKDILNFDIKLSKDEDIDRKELEDKLFNFGYNKCSIVTSTGEYSIRGFIIDLFPYNYDKPLRIELFGNSVESIREFDPATQLSLNNIDSIVIKPYNEIISDTYSSLYDLFDDVIVV